MARGISYLADPHVHPYTAAALGLLINRSGRGSGVGPGAASLGTLAVDNLTRVVIHQRRPPKAGRHHGRNRYGYPSGHTTAATAISVAAAMEIQEGLSASGRALLWGAVATISISVGWSRLYLDEHWIDDVVGGWLAGIAIGCGARSLAGLRE